MPFITTAAVIGAGLAAAGSSAYAAHVQGEGAKKALSTEAQARQDALDFQKHEFETQQANEKPFLEAGQGAVNTLKNYADFKAPTLAEAQQDPGFQFQLGEGVDALDKSAAAAGNLFTGTQGRALTEFGQGLANSTYSNVYNRSLGTYEANLNRLQSLAGEGLTSAGQLGTQGAAAAGNVGNIDITGSRDLAQQYNNMAAAQASGYAGVGNAISGTMNSLGQYAMLKQAMGGGGGTDYGSLGDFAAGG